MESGRTLRGVSSHPPPSVDDDFSCAVAARLAVEADGNPFLEGGIRDEQPASALGAWRPEVFLDAIFQTAAKAGVVMGEALEFVFWALLLGFLASHGTSSFSFEPLLDVAFSRCILEFLQGLLALIFRQEEESWLEGKAFEVIVVGFLLALLFPIEFTAVWREVKEHGAGTCRGDVVEVRLLVERLHGGLDVACW